MDTDKIISTDLVCLECGEVTSIIRERKKILKRRNDNKNKNDIEMLWCFNCKKMTNHYEVKNIDKFMWDVNSRDELKNYVRNLINEKKYSNEQRDSLLKKTSKR